MEEDDKKFESDSQMKHIPPSLKSCSDCHTTRTPLWRGGPAGPKSLCNACGIKYNKKRRQLLGLETARSARKKKTNAANRRSDGESGEIPGGRCSKLLEKPREEERAALLLMALSCGLDSSQGLYLLL